jgi:hypothetical protein
MWEWVYHLLNGVLLLSVFGFIVYIVQIILASRIRIRLNVSSVQSLVTTLLAIVIENIALILCLFWAAAVVTGLIQWATTTWSSQGRLVFSAISALSTLLVLGLVGWVPRRPATIMVGFLSVFMFIVSILVPLLWIRPAYQAAQEAPPSELRIANEKFGNIMQLKGYRIEYESALLPGDELDVWLEWEVLDDTDRDWSVFVHLQDPILETPLAQRDMYPGQGLFGTSILEPGHRFVDHYQLKIPATAIGPSEFPLSVGLYDFFSGERLLTTDGSDAAMLAEVPMQSLQGAVPNPLNVKFENDLHLVGYKIEPRRLFPGEDLSLTLFWQPDQTLDKDYTFFAQVVDEDTTRWASHDLNQPTTRWEALEVYSMTLDLKLEQNTPVGVYPIIIGVYTRPVDGGFDRLQMVTDEGRRTDDFLLLSQIRVD